MMAEHSRMTSLSGRFVSRAIAAASYTSRCAAQPADARHKRKHDLFRLDQTAAGIKVRPHTLRIDFKIGDQRAEQSERLAGHQRDLRQRVPFHLP